MALNLFESESGILQKLGISIYAMPDARRGGFTLCLKVRGYDRESGSFIPVTAFVAHAETSDGFAEDLAEIAAAIEAKAENLFVVGSKSTSKKSAKSEIG